MIASTDFPGRRARAVVAITLLVIVALLYAGGTWLLEAHADARRELDDIGARHARLASLRDATPQIVAALHDATARLDRYAYPVSVGVDRVGADLQQRVRALAATAGLGVVGSQILAPREMEAFQLVSMMATLDGGIEQVHALLHLLAEAEPAIRVEYVGIQQVQQRGNAGGADLRVQLNIVAFHLL
ncbi:type II secretion system protein GspM [Rhodocyclaceae bacterium SMB388]